MRRKEEDEGNEEYERKSVKNGENAPSPNIQNEESEIRMNSF